MLILRYQCYIFQDDHKAGDVWVPTIDIEYRSECRILLTIQEVYQLYRKLLDQTIKFSNNVFLLHDQPN